MELTEGTHRGSDWSRCGNRRSEGKEHFPTELVTRLWVWEWEWVLLLLNAGVVWIFSALDLPRQVLVVEEPVSPLPPMPHPILCIILIHDLHRLDTDASSSFNVHDNGPRECVTSTSRRRLVTWHWWTRSRMTLESTHVPTVTFPSTRMRVSARMRKRLGSGVESQK